MIGLKSLSRRVHRAFRTVERWADRATGAAGPFFVLIAGILIPLCVTTYCASALQSGLTHAVEVVFPQFFVQPDTPFYVTLIALLWSAYLVYGISFHCALSCCAPVAEPADIMAIAIPAGSPRDRSPVQHQFPSLNTLLRSFSRLFTIKRLTICKLEPERQQNESKRAEDLARKRLAPVNRVCKKCPLDGNGQPQVKPERSHHCKICGVCWLKFDHHCPWINACVGLNNERYFVLFMVYLTAGCATVVVTAWQPMLRAFLDYRTPWPHFMPRPCVMLTWIICLALGFAIGIMALWQLWSIAKGETSVETNDNDFYTQLAKSRGKTYVNPYDLGWRENLSYFFGVGPGRRSMYTILVPKPYPPIGDGWSWPKQLGWQANAEAIAAEEELTDEEMED